MQLTEKTKLVQGSHTPRMAYLILAAVRHFAVHLSGGGVVGVDVTLAGHKRPSDEVLQNQVRLRLTGLGHGCKETLPNQYDRLCVCGRRGGDNDSRQNQSGNVCAEVNPGLNRLLPPGNH